jgi:hypothetical protein
VGQFGRDPVNGPRDPMSGPVDGSRRDWIANRRANKLSPEELDRALAQGHAELGWWIDRAVDVDASLVEALETLRRCPAGFCRDAEHCQQGGRCADAVGPLTRVTVDADGVAVDQLPLDLAAVQADDALLERIRHDVDTTEAEEAALLRGWRREVDSRAIPVLVSVGSAVEVVRRARRQLAWVKARRWLSRNMWWFFPLVLFGGAYLLNTLVNWLA